MLSFISYILFKYSHIILHPLICGSCIHVFTSQLTPIRGPNIVDSSAPSKLSNPYQPSQFLTALQYPRLQQALNPTTSRPVDQSPGTVRPLNLPESHIQQGGLQGRIVQAAGANANNLRARVMAPSVPVQNQTSRTASPYAAESFQGSAGEQRGNVGEMAESIARPDGSLNLQSEQNWRPTGRMRGSLSGRQFSDAVRQLISEPSQSGQSVRPQLPRPAQSMQSARPHSPPTILSNSVLPQLLAQIANRNAHNHPEKHNPSG